MMQQAWPHRQTSIGRLGKRKSCNSSQVAHAQHFAHNPQRGISLIELMLVLIVIGTLLFLATRYYQQARENLRVAQAVEMINNVVGASYKWLEGKPNFSGLGGSGPNTGIGALIEAQLLPSSYSKGSSHNDNSNLASPWKRAFQVAPDGDYNIIVRMTEIPTRSCLNLVEKMKSHAVADRSNCGKPGNPDEATDGLFQMSF